MKTKATNNPAFLSWLHDVKACNEKGNFLKIFRMRKNISEDGGLAIEIIQKIEIKLLNKIKVFYFSLTLIKSLSV
jgi:hypothetical protein